MPRWVRAYEGDQDDLYTLRYVVAGGMSVAGLFPLCGVAVGELPGAAAPAIVLFVLMWEVMLWRVTLVGVYVSDYGIKIRMVLHTRVIPWSHVTRAWGGQAANYDAWQIWVSARDPERDFETPIWRRGSRARHRNRIILPPEEFAAVLAGNSSARSGDPGSSIVELGEGVESVEAVFAGGGQVAADRAEGFRAGPGA